MKFRLTLLTSFFILASLGYSQIPDEYGLKFGYVNSRQKWNYLIGGFSNIEDSVEPIDALKIGLYSGWKITSNLGFMLEIYFSQKGSKMVLEGTDAMGQVAWTTDHLFSVDYVETLALFTLNLKYKSVFLYFLVGPRIDYLYYGKAFDYSLQDGLTKVNLGYSLAVGIKTGVFIAPVSLEIRYNPDKTFMHESKNLEIRNFTLDILVGVSLKK